MAFNFRCWQKKVLEFLVFWLKKIALYVSQILLKLRLIGNRSSCRPIRSVIILVIKQIGLPILLITRMITDRIGLHPVLYYYKLHDTKFNYHFITAILKSQNSVSTKLYWSSRRFVETGKQKGPFTSAPTEMMPYRAKLVRFGTKMMRFRTWMTQFRTDVI